MHDEHGDRRRLTEGAVDDLIEVTTDVARSTGTTPWRVAIRAILLLVSGVVLYGLAPRLFDVWDELPRLRSITWWWFPVLLALEVASLACLWKLVLLALPDVSWFVSATSQLAGNAVSKTVPGGAGVGAALQYRMLSATGVEPGTAATALGATGLVTTWILFALPLMALVVSAVGSPVPRGMVSVAWGGALMFVLLFVAGIAITRSDRLILVVGARMEQVNHWVMGRLGRPGGITVTGLLEQRDLMVETLGGRFRAALGVALSKWMLEYLVLVGALLAVGSRPKLSLVLLAYAVSSVLAMIPITPGGLGFVDAGLTAMLTLAGIASSDALLATLAYRLFSYWLTLPAGLIAYIVFRRHFERPAEPPLVDTVPT